MISVVDEVEKERYSPCVGGSVVAGINKRRCFGAEILLKHFNGTANPIRYRDIVNHASVEGVGKSDVKESRSAKLVMPSPRFTKLPTRKKKNPHGEVR